MSRLVGEFGINDADYQVCIHEYIEVDGKRTRRILWTCPVYKTWANMIYRVKSHHNYEDCSISDEWKYFSNFKKWMDSQPHEGLELDKDILVQGNKVYSPTTCTFVPHFINSLLLDCKKSRGDYPLGVRYQPKSNSTINEGLRKKRYSSHISKIKYLGVFITPIQAHHAWQLAKASQIEESVLEWKKKYPNSFNEHTACALLKLTWNLRLDASMGIETVSLLDIKSPCHERPEIDNCVPREFK